MNVLDELQSFSTSTILQLVIEETYTPKQIALALQVSESSVKRWCDRGLIGSTKTGGGHRRIPVESLLLFLQQTNRTIRDASAIGLSDKRVKPFNESRQKRSFSFAKTSAVAPHARLLTVLEVKQQQLFEEALVRGDERECRRIAIQWYAERDSFAAVADELIAPSFRRVGESWHDGEVEIFQERRGCEICTRLIQEFRRLCVDPLPRSPIAIGGSASLDYYTLPGQCVEVVLREVGWRATNLGTNLPFETILSAVAKEHPQVVWLSVSHAEEMSTFITGFNAFASAIPKGVQLIVGGTQLTEEVRTQLAFCNYCDSLQQLAAMARGYGPS